MQVVCKLTESSTIERKFKPLVDLKDHYPKFVVSVDEFFEDNINGVRHMHISGFY